LDVWGWGQLLWSYSFVDMGDETLYDRLCNEIMNHPRLDSYPTHDTAMLPYYAKRVSGDYKILEKFSKSISKVIANQIATVKDMNDLLKISKYVFDGGHGMDPDVINNFEGKMLELGRKNRKSLQDVIMFLPSALSNYKV